MEAVLVSAKVSVFYSKIKKTFPKSSQRFYLAQTLNKQKIKDSNHTRRSKENTYHVVNKNITSSKVTD